MGFSCRSISRRAPGDSLVVPPTSEKRAARRRISRRNALARRAPYGIDLLAAESRVEHVGVPARSQDLSDASCIEVLEENFDILRGDAEADNAEWPASPPGRLTSRTRPGGKGKRAEKWRLARRPRGVVCWEGKV